MRATAICHSDIIMADGGWGGDLPAVFGHEAAGHVASVGAGVEHVAVGDPVVISLIRTCGACRSCVRGQHTNCTATYPIDERRPLAGSGGEPLRHALGTGTFAEYAVVHASQVATLPASMPWASASLLGCGVITGFGAVTNTAQVEAGTHVAVVGCGGVGINSLQAAALSGARTVIAIDPEAAKREGAAVFGATHAVDPSAPDAVEQVQAITGGGVDYALVTVGSRSAIESAQWYLAPGGALVVVHGRCQPRDRHDEPGQCLAAGARFEDGVGSTGDRHPTLTGLYGEEGSNSTNWLSTYPPSASTTPSGTRGGRLDET